MANSLIRPFQPRMLIALLLSYIPIANFLADGYKIKCAQTFNTQQLPEWREWGKLFVQGLALRAIQLVYAAPALFILGWFAFFFRPDQLGIAELLPTLLFGRNIFFAMLVFLVVAAWFAPSAVLSYAFEGRFRAAFSLGVVKRTLSLAYLKSWGLSGLYLLAIFGLIYFYIYYVSAILIDNLLVTLPYAAGLYLILTVSGITYWTMLAKGYYQAYSRTGY